MPRPRAMLCCLLLLAGSGPALALPSRGAPSKPQLLRWEPGRQERVLIVKLAPGQRIDASASGVQMSGADPTLHALLQGAEPLFSRPPAALRADRDSFDPEHRLADLSLYLRLELADRATASARGRRLLARPEVETAYFAFAPVRPPSDIPPTTPDLAEVQAYRGPAPDGLGMDVAPSWPGASGQGITIADIEYDWNPDHEDLDAILADTHHWGTDSGDYPCHGTLVLGTLVAGDNGYGVTGLVPQADVLMISPYTEEGDYSIADAIDGAAALLDRGDVLLIEQQVRVGGRNMPVEVEPAVFDAITMAVARGIVVVEPAANGGVDLDDPEWEGWFDREEQDSGAIMVGGGVPPGDEGTTPRAWAGGSSYGERVDLQGWYSGVATTCYSPELDPYCSDPDLFFPDDDGNQGYTSNFGGTSAAAPLVAAVAVAAQGVAMEVRGAPWDPMDLRAALVSTGTPQKGEEHIGPQPDLRRFLRTWGVK